MALTFSRRIIDIFKQTFAPADKKDMYGGVGLQAGNASMEQLLSASDAKHFTGYQYGNPAGAGIDPQFLPSREQEVYSTNITAVAQRKERYSAYERLEETVHIAKLALDTYAEEIASSDENGNVLKIICSNETIKNVITELFLNKNFLNLNEKMYAISRNLCKYGDTFLEIVVDSENPKLGVLKISELDVYSTWRCEDRGGRLIEFQQAADGPNTQIIYREMIDKINKEKSKNDKNFITLYQSESTQPDPTSPASLLPIRFHKKQIAHIRIDGGCRPQYKPYGESILDPAVRPGYNLRMLEDSMLMYWITRAPERRVYYVDVTGIIPSRINATIQEWRDKLKRKKVWNERTGQMDQRFNAWTVDDDLFLPVKANKTQTKVETLPGASNADNTTYVDYFKMGLYTALGIPMGYLEQNPDSKDTQFTLSATNSKFAKRIQRIQRAIESALYEIAYTHLALIGVPEAAYKDIQIKLTPPSEWREAMLADMMNQRITLAGNIRGLEIVSNHYIATNILKLTEEDAKKEEELFAIEKLQRKFVEAQESLIMARAEAEIEVGKNFNAIKVKSELAIATGKSNAESLADNDNAQEDDLKDKSTIDDVEENSDLDEEGVDINIGETPNDSETNSQKEYKKHTPLDDEKSASRSSQ